MHALRPDAAFAHFRMTGGMIVIGVMRHKNPAGAAAFIGIDEGIVHDGLRSLGVKAKRHLMNALAAHGFAHSGLLRLFAIEQQESAAACAGDFSPESAALEPEGVQLIDARSRNLGGNPALGLPAFVQQLPKPMEFSPFKAGTHPAAKRLHFVQSLDRSRVPAACGCFLLLQNAPGMMCSAAKNNMRFD